MRLNRKQKPKTKKWQIALLLMSVMSMHVVYQLPHASTVALWQQHSAFGLARLTRHDCIIQLQQNVLFNEHQLQCNYTIWVSGLDRFKADIPHCPPVATLMFLIWRPQKTEQTAAWMANPLAKQGQFPLPEVCLLGSLPCDFVASMSSRWIISASSWSRLA